MRNKIYVYYPPREITKRYKIPNPLFLKKENKVFLRKERRAQRNLGKIDRGTHTHGFYNKKRRDKKMFFFLKKEKVKISCDRTAFLLFQVFLA